MNQKKTLCLALLTTFAATAAFAQVPGVIQYQGRVTTHGTNFSGAGQFKFAIIEETLNGDSLWSNDGTSVDGSEPAGHVPVQVQDGLFIVGLGDTSMDKMVSIDPSVFTFEAVKLRIWFSDGVGAFAALSPDQRITSVGFAMMAANVPDGSITAAKLAAGAVTSNHIASNAVGAIHLLNQSITASKISSNSIGSGQISDVLTLQQLDLGSTSWNGVLNLWAQGASESRGLLGGDNTGSLLNLKFSNSSTGAVLSARSPGARLNLWDSQGKETTLLGAGNGGGELKLFQLNGEIGIYLDGDKANYGNVTSTGGEIEVRNSSGVVGLLLDGQDTGGGGGLSIMDSAGDTATVEILGSETASTGSELRMRRANGTLTMLFDAEYDADGGPRVDWYNGFGVSTMAFLPGGGDATLAGGGLIRLGDLAGTNMVIDGNEIIARTNSGSSPLYLNYGYTAPVHMTRVAINTSTPATGYSLSVNGKVICEELVIQNSNDWPDYVFAEDYNLPPLEEVEASIEKNKHLPGIPSAKQVGEAGIPLGEMQRQMMEKIEELTLYVIQQNKRLQAQETQIEALRARLVSPE